MTYFAQEDDYYKALEKEKEILHKKGSLILETLNPKFRTINVNKYTNEYEISINDDLNMTEENVLPLIEYLFERVGFEMCESGDLSYLRESTANRVYNLMEKRIKESNAEYKHILSLAVLLGENYGTDIHNLLFNLLDDKYPEYIINIHEFVTSNFSKINLKLEREFKKRNLPIE